MKILVVSRRFPPETFGGGEISAHLWCKLLARDNEVHVLTTGKGEVQKTDITVHRQIPPINRTWPLDLHNNEIFYSKTKKALRNMLKTEKYDIIHAFNMNTIPPAVKAARREKKPVIATINDHWGTCYFRTHFHEGKVWEICPPSVIKRNMKSHEISTLALPYILHAMRVRKRSMRKSHKLIAISSWVKRILGKNGFYNVDVLFNPVDFEAFKAKKFQSTGNVLYVGRLDQGKGIETLLKATASAQKKVSFNLIIAGTGNLEHYRKLAAENKVKVEFKGKVSYSEVPDLISESDLVVAPFERVEAFGRSISEAGACGRAVITTNIAGGSEIVDNGINGLIVPPLDSEALGRAIEDLMTNKAKLKAMGIEGRKIVENELDNGILLKKLMNAYNGVLGVQDSGSYF
jgi:glycosyltransferase involved in cell wall biosynthesis